MKPTKPPGTPMKAAPKKAEKLKSGPGSDCASARPKANVSAVTHEQPPDAAAEPAKSTT